GLRFGLALVVLGLPATLIGATLPVMARLVCRPRSLPASFSLLYAINTLGAVVGAGLTGFVLLHQIGLQHTLWMASGLNLLIAVAAFRGDCRLQIADCRLDEEAGRPIRQSAICNLQSAICLGGAA